MAMTLPQPLQHAFTPSEAPQAMAVVQPVLDRLEALPVATREELDAFLAAWNETSCWLNDHIAKTRVAASRFTDDEATQQAWRQLVSEVIPAATVIEDRLARKFLAAPELHTLEEGAHAPFLKQVRAGVELFREANVPLQQREQELINEYQQVSGSWGVDFQGERRTMSGMQKFLADPDREVRKAAWLAMAAEVARTSEQLEDLFERLFAVRHEIAQNAGFENYRDYIFAAKLRDYDADACHNFAAVVEEVVVPLQSEIARRTADALGLPSFAPWDGMAEPDGGAPLTPFEETTALEEGVERMMRRLDEELGEQFAQIRANMDLAARPGKAQGGFMSWYAWDQRPFIFANASGSHSDIVTLLHEAGHAFHGLLTALAGSKPMADVSVPMEFNEVASMSMELLHYDTLDEFYGPTDASRAIQQHLRRVVRIFGATMLGDQFQHWLYTHPTHTRQERRARWIELNEKFSPHVDRSELDAETLANTYHQTLHFFIVPFYYIEYAFAQFGALQVAMRAEQDRRAALEAYKAALKLGPLRDVRGLFEAAGAAFDPTPATLGGAMDWVRARLH